MNQECGAGSQANPRPTRVLLVEDNPMDALLLGADFSKLRPAEFRLTTAGRLSEVIPILDTTPIDVILLECTGLETLFRVREIAPDVPVVILTGLDDEGEALRALKHGAQDYLIKGNLDSKMLFRAIRYAIERKQAEETLRSSEQRYRELFENATDGIYTLDLDGRFTSANRMWQQITGYGHSELIGKPITELVPEPFHDTLRRAIDCRTAEAMVCEVEFVTKNGSHVPVEVSSRLIKDKGKPIGLQGIARDRMERRLFEQRLLQKQKLEAVGTLAGGVAHNFNNALTVILGHCNLMLEAMTNEDENRDNIESVKKAAGRAALLTRQLFAFAQKQGAAPTRISVNGIVLGMQLLLESVLGENIALELKLAPNVSLIKADPVPIQQIVMHLAVNSRDAMPQGGQLTIETAEIRSDPSMALPAEAQVGLQGLQVLLTVTDTGCGMSPETREHIFEPFFTTKGLAEASGLGLSIVYGLVKQSGGAIAVSSEPGRGTRFTLAFPAAAPSDCADPGVQSAS
ncbi:MAG: PAS domain S-box protein [Acidobacteria bacterium]|nr:PAS domain S-box protein [Acidobacteriota bacterium]